MAMDERGFKRKHSDVAWFLDVKLIRSVYDFVDGDGQPIKSSQDGKQEAADAGEGLTQASGTDRLEQLSLALAAPYAEPGTSGIFCESSANLDAPEKKQGSCDGSRSTLQNDLAENALLALVRTGIENDFERVVFPIHPPLREIKRQLMGIASADCEPGVDLDGSALYAALSGSGSALFGLYRSSADAKAAQQRVQGAGVKAVLTHTLPRSAYWRTMFAG